MMPGNKDILVVLGMHRSGTSMVTRVFDLLGASPGNNLMPPAEDNPEGFWEPVDLVGVHDELLDYLGFSWDDPRPFPDKWWEDQGVEVYIDKLQSLAQEQYLDTELPILKDPRLCRLLPLWNIIFKRLGWQPHYIMVGRSPLEVADSLLKRNMLEPEHSYLLWLRYILEAEKNSRDSNRVFISYENLINDFEPGIKRCLKVLNLDKLELNSSSKSAIKGIINTKLRHNIALDSD